MNTSALTGMRYMKISSVLMTFIPLQITSKSGSGKEFNKKNLVMIGRRLPYTKFIQISRAR